MPGMAPAKVQHNAIRLSRSRKEEVTPYWDDDRNAWLIPIDARMECSQEMHSLMDEGGCSHCAAKNCDAENHTVHVEFRFTRRGSKRGPGRWIGAASVSVDGAPSHQVPVGVVMSMLAKPTNPQGDGKVTTSSDIIHTMPVRSRTTITRV